MSMARLTLMILAALVFLSAVGVVYSKNASRDLYAELRALQQDRDNMEVEWGKLLLEQSTLATDGRIEGVARRKLEMKIPEIDSVVMVR